MPHIHIQPHQHDLTVSGYIIRLDQKEPGIMLHKHRKLNQYLQFGGHVELEENPWQAIRRELKEESGYELSHLEVLQPTNRVSTLTDADVHPYPIALMTIKFGDLDHYHTDIAYAFTATTRPTKSIDDLESQDIKIFSPQELRDLPHSHIPENVRELSLSLLDNNLDQWERINAGYCSSSR